MSLGVVRSGDWLLEANHSCEQGRNLNKLLGDARGCPANIFCLLWPFYFCFSNISSPMVLSPVSCPAEVHCTTIFALRSGKFLRWGGGMIRSPILSLSFPLKFRSCLRVHMETASCTIRGDKRPKRSRTRRRGWWQRWLPTSGWTWLWR